MDEKLLKELYLSGFPDLYFEDGMYTHRPTLSELIEACGDDVVLEKSSLRIKKYRWIAGEFITNIGEIDRMFFGKTPEESVARLWLALNKK